METLLLSDTDKEDIKSLIDTLITDRTQSDVNKKVRKAYYMADDINRVEGAVKGLSNMLVSLPLEIEEYAESRSVAFGDIYNVPYNPDIYRAIETKTDWNNLDCFYVLDGDYENSDAYRYLHNVELLIDAFPSFNTEKIPETLVRLTWYGANAIEKALVGLYVEIQKERERLMKLVDSTGIDCYSGEYYLNEFPYVTGNEIYSVA